MKLTLVLVDCVVIGVAGARVVEQARFRVLGVLLGCQVVNGRLEHVRELLDLVRHPAALDLRWRVFISSFLRRLHIFPTKTNQYNYHICILSIIFCYVNAPGQL